MKSVSNPFPLYFLFFLFLVPGVLFAGAPPDSDCKILQKVFEVNKSIRTASFTLLTKERIGTDFVQKKTDFKVAFTPFKVYLKQYYPNQGMEILYLDGENNGKALINRNAFAFSSIKLDPLGNAVRKGNHHSLFKAGFSFFVDVLENLYVKYSNTNSANWHYQGIVLYGDKECHKITIDIPQFHFKNYTIKKGDNLENLSRKFKICDYLIVEHNPHIRSFDEIAPGMEILIPSDYAKQLIVYIDKVKLVPVGLKAYDDKGLFEEYSYINVSINPEFNLLDFDSSNKAYGFK
jgi:hypothetical protein